MERGLHVSVVSPSKPLYEGKAESVIVPLYDGLAGILKGHVNMIAELGPGKLIIKASEEEMVLFVSGGFLEVSRDEVTILANDAYKKKELKIEEIEKEYQEVQSQEAIGDEAIQNKLQRQNAVRKKLAFAKE